MEALALNIAALREEKAGLAEEQRKLSALEAHLEDLIEECCKPSEQDKYHMFVGDLEKIVNLLLSLCSRLVRVENSLRGLEEEEEAEDNAKEKVRTPSGCSQIHPQQPSSTFVSNFNSVIISRSFSSHEK